MNALSDDPFTSRGHTVQPEWIDAYDHMNMAKYVQLFDDVTYALLDRVDLGLEYTKRTKQGLFVVDARVKFLKEVRVGIPLEVTMRLVGIDHVRLHLWLEMRAAGSNVISATQEQVGLHADLALRKTLRFSDGQRNAIQAVVDLHRAEPAYSSRKLSLL